MKIITLKICVILTLLFTLLTTSCSKSNEPCHAASQIKPKIQVLCTIGMISDLVKEIGKDKVEVVTLISENLDPHTYELVKGDDEKFSYANLIFYNGLGLEHNPSIFRHLNEHSNSYALGDYIKKKYPESILFTDGQVDPHIWMDISIWSKTTQVIQDALIKLDSENQELYKSNCLHLQSELEKAHQETLLILRSIPDHKRYLVSCHDAFFYFARRYLAQENEYSSDLWRKRFKAPEGLAPDCQLSTQDILDVVTHIKAYQIQTIFPESGVNLDSIHKIQEVTLKMGHPISIAPAPLYGDCMGNQESNNTYIKMIKHNAKTIAKYIYE